MNQHAVHAAIAAVGLLLVACAPSDPAPEAAAPKINGNTITLASRDARNAIKVDAVATERGEVLRLNGRIVWDEDRTVRILTPYSGRVVQIFAQPGERVRAGQTLANLASPDFGQAQADARRAATDFAAAEKNLRRVQDLFDHGVSPEKDLHQAQADHARAQAERQRTQARLRLYGVRDDQVNQIFHLQSPLAGTVVERNINPGQELRADQPPANGGVFVVTDPTHLWVQLDASEKDIARVRPGQQLTLRSEASPDESFAARVTTVSDAVDAQTRMVRVRGRVDNPAGKLKGEMFVTAEVAVPSAGSLRVPATAVYLYADRQYVFTEDDAGSFTRREVKAGGVSGGSVTIDAGLKAGQKVVVSGALLLQQLLDASKGAS